MDMKKCFLAGLAGFVVMFLISTLWYVVIMEGFYQTHGEAVNREQFSFLFIILGYIVMAFLMSYMYPAGYKGGSPIKEGMRFGVLAGLLIWLSSNLVLHGVWDFTLSLALVDSAYHIVEQGIGGLVIGLVYGTAAKS